MFLDFAGCWGSGGPKYPICLQDGKYLWDKLALDPEFWTKAAMAFGFFSQTTGMVWKVQLLRNDGP